MAQLIPVAIGLAFSGLSMLINRPPTIKNTVEGARADTKVPDAALGFGLDRFYGTCKKTNCSMIWALPLEEVVTKKKKKSGGKGGGGTETTEITYTYYLTAAYAIGGEITQLKKVYATGYQIYGRGGDQDSLFNDKVEVFYGTTNQSPSAVIASHDVAPNLVGISYIVFDRFPVASLSERGTQIGFPTIDVEVVGLEASINNQYCLIGDIIKDICILSGIPEENLDVTDIGDSNSTLNEVNGYALESGKTYRQAIEELQQTHFFVIQEDKEKIEFIKQKREFPKIILRERHLGATAKGDPSLYLQSELNAEELPSHVTLTYKNIENKLEQDTVSSYNPAAEHYNEKAIQTTAAMNPLRARFAIDRILWEIEYQNTSITDIFLLPSWYELKAGDTFGIIKENDSQYAQLWQVTNRIRGNNYLLQIEGVKFRGVIEYDIVNEIDIVAEGAVDTPSVPEYDDNDPDDPINPEPPNLDDGPDSFGTAEIIPLDIPRLLDGEPDWIYYAAVQPTNSSWLSGGIYVSDDGGNSFSLYETTSVTTFTGTAITALPDHCSALPDNSSVLRVQIDDTSMQLSSAVLEDFLRGLSLLYIGGEIVAYQTVTLITADPLVYDISGLMRGRRGTESYTDGHSIGEQVIFLSDVEDIEANQNDIGKPYLFKAVGAGVAEEAVTTETAVTPLGTSAKPYPPMPILAAKSGDDWLIQWYRRTNRYGGIKDFADIGYSLGELEIFRIEILSPTDTVLRAIETTDRNYTYTQAQQVEDGMTGDLRIRIYQLSSLPVGLAMAKIFEFSETAIMPIVDAPRTPTTGDFSELLDAFYSQISATGENLISIYPASATVARLRAVASDSGLVISILKNGIAIPGMDAIALDGTTQQFFPSTTTTLNKEDTVSFRVDSGSDFPYWLYIGLELLR